MKEKQREQGRGGCNTGVEGKKKKKRRAIERGTPSLTETEMLGKHDAKREAEERERKSKSEKCKDEQRKGDCISPAAELW